MEIKEEGLKLIITFTKEEVREIKEDLKTKIPDIIWSDLFYNDTHSLGNNSDYDYWAGANGSQMHEFTGSLTNSPLITRGADLNDDGDIVSVDMVSWFPNYQVENEFGQLPTIIFDIAE